MYIYKEVMIPELIIPEHTEQKLVGISCDNCECESPTGCGFVTIRKSMNVNLPWSDEDRKKDSEATQHLCPDCLGVRQ